MLLFLLILSGVIFVVGNALSTTTVTCTLTSVDSVHARRTAYVEIVSSDCPILHAGHLGERQDRIAEKIQVGEPHTFTVASFDLWLGRNGLSFPSIRGGLPDVD
ncbi:hypothetical protein F8O06_05000 [Pseudoclavibacter sp. CFCC 14310]|uniref:hypothetical protein n=1 Tax=Pseudoclavibacter sp. CFCC 14310 TaxID=2615180 RepID=UPI001301975F|nr:hypothetical protein [Pseudoclavibacter sp. CFCC 14310]KAB1645418.1 hypothetical protein F8O06_07445 [Pseudoclavibacter sp. CFCC 14310]KAB1646123.1 hypothetical protein F8O06_05000 [Pseudoclavibacter sp. CFCC 14310]